MLKTDKNSNLETSFSGAFFIHQTDLHVIFVNIPHTRED